MSLSLVRRDRQPRSLFLEFDDVFKDFFGAPTAASSFQPRLDLQETATEFKLFAELPGLTESEIDLEVNNDSLTLKGEKKSETKEGDDNQWYFERAYGRFERTVPLPSDVKINNVSAKLRNGLLEVVLPKVEEAKARKIKVA